MGVAEVALDFAAGGFGQGSGANELDGVGAQVVLFGDGLADGLDDGFGVQIQELGAF